MNQLEGPSEETFFEDASLFAGSRDGQTQNWLRRKDHAWNPFGDPASISPIDLHPPTPSFITANPNAFLEYRSAGIRSDCDTLHGDSGYGSIFDNTSHYDEPFNPAPVPNLDHDIPEFKISLQPDHLFGPGELQGGYMGPSSAAAPKFLCPICHDPVKTKSELKKHELRHTKPFRCQNADCSKKDRGFASQNDLTRHQMTVHGEHALGKTYYCNLDGCARKTKLWPRADNFRSHLQRVHKLKLHADADLSQYLNHSRESHPIAEDLSGIGTQLQVNASASVPQESNPHESPQDPIRDFPDVQTQPAPRHLHVANEASIEGLLPPASQSAYVTSTAVEPSVSDYSFGNEFTLEKGLPGAANQLQVPRSLPKQESVSPTLDAQSFPQDDVQDVDAESGNSSGSDDDSDVKDIQDLPPIKGSSAEASPDLLQYLRKLPPHLLKEALANTTELEAKSDQSLGAVTRKSACDKCKKTFNRPCELRKHMKRHERPYGCTVPCCTKRFGSKNDWKRHERGQHSRTEIWTCDLFGCPYFSYQREGLDTHLRSHHNIIDAHQIDGKLDNNRRGGHCVNEFWCGFCKQNITINPTKSDDIDQRFDHVDHHFMGRNDLPKKDITAWCHPEDFFEEFLHKQYTEHGRKRKPVQQDANPRPKRQNYAMST